MCEHYLISKADLEFILTGFVPLGDCLNAVERGYAPQNFMHCFLYALWQAGADPKLIKEQTYRCSVEIKHVKLKIWNTVCKNLG